MAIAGRPHRPLKRARPLPPPPSSPPHSSTARQIRARARAAPAPWMEESSAAPSAGLATPGAGGCTVHQGTRQHAIRRTEALRHTTPLIHSRVCPNHASPPRSTAPDGGNTFAPFFLSCSSNCWPNTPIIFAKYDFTSGSFWYCHAYDRIAGTHAQAQRCVSSQHARAKGQGSRLGLSRGTPPPQTVTYSPQDYSGRVH